MADDYVVFREKNFAPETLDIIRRADSIIQQYSADGYTLTLRQLYYQFVAKDLIENSERSYKRLGSIVTDARMAGELPWDGIEDRGRGVNGWLVEEDIDEVLKDLPRGFAADMWADQDSYVEVWVEKEALGAVVQRAAETYRVAYMSCKGYLSASEAYRAGARARAARERGKHPVVFHLGDHDPSGLDMTRDNADRLDLFSHEAGVEVRRLGLNRDQIDRYNPPPNPTKVTDSRAPAYLAAHGNTSWELDALEPSVLVALIEDAISPLVDLDLWERALDRERESRALLRGVRSRWVEVQKLLET